MLVALRNKLIHCQTESNNSNLEISEKNKQFFENEEKIKEPIPPHETIKKEEMNLIQLKNNVGNYIKKIEENKDDSKEEKL